MLNSQMRQNGKTELLMASIEFARLSGKTILIGTADQVGTAARITRRFSGALCSIEGDMWVRPHFKGRTKRKSA